MPSFRKADKDDDLSQLASLIYDTDEYIYPVMTRGDKAAFIGIMQDLLLIPGHVFSLTNIFVAENSGRISALCVMLGAGSKMFEMPALPDDFSAGFYDVVNRYFLRLIGELDGLSDDEVYILCFCVNKEDGRKGIGHGLLNYIIGQYENKTIFLDCIEANLAAVRLYEQAGFNITERYSGFASDPSDDIPCVRMMYRASV